MPGQPPRHHAQLPRRLAALAADGERSIAWLVADGRRRVPYRGVQRNELWWSLRVAAVNLRRLLVLGLPAMMVTECWPDT